MAEERENKLIARVKKWYDRVTHKDDPHYISGKEARRIARENFKITREYEKKKRRHVEEKDYLSEMKDDNNILEIENLHTYFFTDAGVAKSVDGVSFEVPKKSVVGVVGESGCGKSVTSLSVMQLVQAPQGQIVEGSIRFASQDYKRCGQDWEYAEKGTNVPATEALLDRAGKPVLDKLTGTPLVRPTGRTVVVGDDPVVRTEPAVDKAGNFVLDENGTQLLRLVRAKPAGQPDWLQLEDGAPIPIWERVEAGAKVPVTEPLLDRNGKPVLDKKTGTPLMRATGGEREVTAEAPAIRTEPAVSKKGEPLLDENGTPLLRLVQAKDGNGFPAFETVEKVYDIAKMPTSAMQRIRGKEISMIFQEPMTSLNPLFTIGNQLDEVVLLHTPGADKELAKNRSIEMLKLVGIAMPENVYKCYPHELSGGMRQRVMIAMALACNPKLIIADEPTTALDVTIQAQVLDLLKEIKEKINGSIMLITHDLGVIAGMADYVVVMYAGRIIEKGTVEDIFDRPMHPYTVGLQKSKPVINKDVDTLFSIHGQVPNPIDMPNYCYFKDRCDVCMKQCDGEYPPLVQVSPTHFVACYRAGMNKEGKA